MDQKWIIVELSSCAILITLCVILEYDLSSVGEEEEFEMRQLTDLLCDWQVNFLWCTLDTCNLLSASRVGLVTTPNLHLHCCAWYVDSFHFSHMLLRHERAGIGISLFLPYVLEIIPF